MADREIKDFHKGVSRLTAKGMMTGSSLKSLERHENKAKSKALKGGMENMRGTKAAKETSNYTPKHQ